MTSLLNDRLRQFTKRMPRSTQILQLRNTRFDQHVGDRRATLGQCDQRIGNCFRSVSRTRSTRNAQLEQLDQMLGFRFAEQCGKIIQAADDRSFIHHLERTSAWLTIIRQQRGSIELTSLWVMVAAMTDIALADILECRCVALQLDIDAESDNDPVRLR